jgi:Protein of unknown function (DUF1194)
MRILLLVLLMVFAPGALAQSNLAEKDNSTPTADVELVLAVDISYSTLKDDLAKQRESYAQAIVSKEFLEALKNGPVGKLAVTYFEWSASNYQNVVVPWRVIDGPEAAAAVAAEIMKASAVPQTRTSISGAINFAMSLFDNSPYRGARRVIDISGNGPNNSGDLVEGSRNAALAKGVTINGLPIMVRKLSPGSTDVIRDLDLYYEDCVTGGPGSFVMTVKDRDEFKEAIRTMLVFEVAGLAPERQSNPPAGREKRISCTIGEKAYDSIWSKSPGALPDEATLKPPPKFWPWQYAGFVAYTKKCLLRQKEKIRNRVELSATIGPDGMIVGDPEITSPRDSDAFRRDVTTALKKLQQCQPYIVDPFGRTRIRFTQKFKFQDDEAVILPIMPLPTAARRS